MTTQQAIRGKRIEKKKKVRTAILKINGQNSPFRLGVVEKVLIRTPKKPNSAQRKVAMVRVRYKQKFTKGVSTKVIAAYIPDENQTLQSHATVLLKGGAAQDTPGLAVSVCRGLHDAANSKNRKNKRSKFGVSKPAAAKKS